MNNDIAVIENKNKLFSWCFNSNVNIEKFMKAIDDIYSELLSFDDKKLFLLQVSFYIWFEI